jgi:hypothetical protein
MQFPELGLSSPSERGKEWKSLDLEGLGSDLSDSPGSQHVAGRQNLKAWCSVSSVMLRQWNLFLAKESRVSDHHVLHCPFLL